MQGIDNTRRGLVWQAEDGRVLALLAVLVACLFLPGLGSFGILDPSDGYYSEGAREMLESGDFLTPHLNYQPWFDKPILTYWLIALSYKLFGVNELAARLPSALCGGGLILFVYFLARQFLRRRTALFSAFVLCSMPMFLTVGHVSVTDMPLCFLVWLATGCLLIGISRNSRFITWLGYLGLGLGFLCKGPLAVFLVANYVVIFLLVKCRSQQDLWQCLKKAELIPGILIAGSVALPWYVMETMATNGAFFQHFFLNENVNRALGAVDHKAAFWYYVPVIFGGAFPWSLILLLLLPFIGRLFGRKNSRFLKDQIVIFSLAAFLFTASFFSLLPTKLITYVLPVFPALAILSGSCLDKLACLSKSRLSLLKWSGPLLVLTIVCAGAAAIIFRRKLPVLPDIVWSMMIALLMFYSAYTAAFWRKRVRKSISFLIAGAVISCAVLVPVGLGVAYDLKCADFHELVRQVRKLKIDPLMVGRRNPSAMFYLHHQVNFSPNAEALIQLLKTSDGERFLLIDRGCLDALLRSRASVKIMSQKGNWYLLSASGSIKR